MIAYFEGPEGAGKSALMTFFALKHYREGGEVWSFPGYELKNNTGRVVSRLVFPEEIMGLLNEMQYVVLTIDEIQNFMNHHNWHDKLVDIMSYGAAAQRRKRGFVILATGPIFEWLPSDLRQMFHVIFTCRDCHWQNKSISRGYQIAFTATDNRGILSGRPGTRSKERLFYPKNIFKHYESFALVDPKYLNRKIRIKKDEFNLDSSGHILEDSKASDPATLNKFIENYQLVKENNLTTELRKVLTVFEQKGLQEFDSSLIYDVMNVQRQGEKAKIGSALPHLGWQYSKWNKKYIKVTD